MMRAFVFLLLMITGFTAAAQGDRQAVTDYINAYKEIAISEMQRTGVPAAIKLGQGILESGAGRSDLVQRSNNHFGIKCKSSWTGERVYHDDDESQECFRKYPSGKDSYIDHSNFLRQNPRYGFLFDLDPTNYREWAYGLKKAGYATENRYAEAVIKCIENYELQQYSLIALGKQPPAISGEAAADVTPPAATDADAAAPDAPLVVQPTYPEGIFTINGAKVLFAAKGTALLAIANEQEIPLDHLIDFNDLQGSDVLEKSQLVFLERKRKQGEKPFHIVQEGESLYDIAQSQGLRISALCGYNQLERNQWPAPGERLYLQGNNPVRPATVIPVTIRNGGTINLPAEEVKRSSASGGYMSKEALEAYRRNVQTPKEEPVAEAAPVAETKAKPVKKAEPAAKKKQHKVQAKESLYTIAKKYGVTVAQLKGWNKLETAHIRTGQVLIIYQ
jgi:LysM repeat protein